MTNSIRVTLETGPKGKKVVVVAPDWPGLARGENPIARVQPQRVQAYGKAIALTPAAVRHKLQAIDRSTLDGLRDHALLAITLQTGRGWPRSQR